MICDNTASQTITRVELYVVQGEDLVYVVTCLDSNGDALNLAGASASMDIRQVVQDEEAVLELTVGDGITLDEEAGTVTIRITAAQSAEMSGVYVWNILVTDAGGIVTDVSRGTINVLLSVTR